MAFEGLSEALSGIDSFRLQREEQQRPVAATPLDDQFSAPSLVSSLDSGQRTPEELQAGILSGRFNLDPIQSYQVVDDKGVAQQVVGRELLRALDRGWQLDSADLAAQRQERARVGAIEAEESQAPFRTFARTFGNELALGIPERLMSPEDRERFQVGQRVNPTASGLGQAAGYAADAALVLGTGGGAAALKLGAKAASKAAPRIAARVAEGVARREVLPTVAKAAARGAVESAAVDVPRAVTEAALGDPEEAAEGLALSVGLGSVVSGLLGGAGAVARKGADVALGRLTGTSIRSADDVGRAVGELSDRQAVQAAGGDEASRALGMSRKEHAQFLRDEGLMRRVGEADKDYLSRLREQAALRQQASRAPLVDLDSTVSRELRPTAEDLVRGTSAQEKRALDRALDDVLFDEQPVVLGGRLGKDRRLSLASLGEAQERLIAEAATTSDRATREALERAVSRIDDAFSRIDPGVAVSRKAALRSARLTQASADVVERLAKEGRDTTLAQDAFDLFKRGRGFAGKVTLAGLVDPTLVLPVAAKHLFERAGGVDAFRVALAARGAGTRTMTRDQLRQLQRQVYGGSALLAIADASITHGRRLLVDGIRGRTRSAISAASPIVARMATSDDQADSDPRRRALDEGQRVIDAAEALESGAALSSQLLLEEEAPGLGAAHRQHVQRSLRWLADRAPRLRQDPIDGDVLPTRREARSFELLLRTAFDPDRAAADVRAGRGRPEQVEALQALFPRQWQRAQEEALTIDPGDDDPTTGGNERRGKAMALQAPRTAFHRRRSFTEQVMGWGEQQQQQQGQQGSPPPQRPSKAASMEMSPADRTALRSQLG